jgi:hypothetical protein
VQSHSLFSFFTKGRSLSGLPLLLLDFVSCVSRPLLAFVVACPVLPCFTSSFQLNLSSLSLPGARERLARLEASGGSNIPRLFSPPAGVGHSFGRSSPSPFSPPVCPWWVLLLWVPLLQVVMVCPVSFLFLGGHWWPLHFCDDTRIV